MAKYRKKSEVIEASRWFKNGDHPEDVAERFSGGEFVGELYEGKVVRYFRRSDIMDEDPICSMCGQLFYVHGWMDTTDDDDVHLVCPGDWIITRANGERRPCKPNIFEQTYEAM